MLVNLLIDSSKSHYYFPVASREITVDKVKKTETLFLVFYPTEIHGQDMVAFTTDPRTMPDPVDFSLFGQAVAEFAADFPDLLESLQAWVNGDKLSRTAPVALYQAGYLSKAVYDAIVLATVNSWAAKNNQEIIGELEADNFHRFMLVNSANDGTILKPALPTLQPSSVDTGDQTIDPANVTLDVTPSAQ